MATLHNIIVKKNQELEEKIIQICEQYLNDISKILQAFCKEKINIEEAQEQLLDCYYDALTQVYIETSLALKSMYGELKEQVIDIKDLTYDADGKTLEDRINYYINEGKNLLKTTKNSHDIHLYLLTMLDRLLITEAAHVKSGVKKAKPPVDIEGIVWFIHITDGECCTHGGDYSIDEAPDLPPYHPNCQCDWWYDCSSDIDDITDLDLQEEVE